MKEIISFHYVGLFTSNEEEITVYFCEDFFHIHEYKSALNQGFKNVFKSSEWYDSFMIGYETSIESLQTAVETYLDKIDSNVYDLLYKEA